MQELGGLNSNVMRDESSRIMYPAQSPPNREDLPFLGGVKK
jgi:hypothetical protein